jgi:predicted nucleic acid-binding protein
VKIVIDAYAWVEIFIGSKKGDKARENLTEADETYTPDVVMAEIARKYFREGVEEQTILERLKTIEETSDIATINKDVALESAKCYMQLSEKAKAEGLKSPSLFDAIVLATARLLNAKVVTGDEHFKHMPETLWIG